MNGHDILAPWSPNGFLGMVREGMSRDDAYAAVVAQVAEHDVHYAVMRLSESPSGQRILHTFREDWQRAGFAAGPWETLIDPTGSGDEG
ncbi:MAG: hypothetical protein NVS4B8_24440 [Herpetosiphon sp.]